MLKILRCHLSCVGNRSARFSPVTLNFTAENGAGNSVVFLENGGGKTTLAAFLYLTLWPEQNHFLLKKAKDAQVRVADYLMPGQTAYVVLECETRMAGLLDEPIVRVIGQVLQRRDSTERSPVNRHFFTFLPCAEMTFDDLPIHGINGRSNSLNYDDFRAWLKERQVKCAGAELWDGSSVEEYIKKLREIHAEPELVRVQVDLNKREGGIDEHFKEHCADSRKFVHTLLDLALQSAKGEETVGVLGKFLTEWQNVGHLEDETTFCDDFAAALATLADVQAHWTQSEQKLRDAQRRAGGIWRNLNRRVEELRQQHHQTGEELRLAKIQVVRAKQDMDNSYHHTLSYELEWLELRAREAAQIAAEAEATCKEAKRSNDLVKLAVLLGEIERRRRDLDTKRRILAEKQAELAPLLAKLHLLGAAFAAKIGEEQNRQEAELVDTTRSLSAEEERTRYLEKMQQDLAVDKNEQARTLEDVKVFFDRRRSQREQLGSRGFLASNERAEDGRTRWDTKRQSEDANVVEQREHQQQSGQRLAGLNNERTRIQGEAATANSEVTQLQDKIDEARRERDQLTSHDLILAHFNQEFDPLQHGTEEAVARKQIDVFHVLLNLQLDLAASQRHREGITQYQVLPPPRDVESVWQRLREAGIEAWLGLSYLAETCDCEEAERIIRSDPARYAGVLVSPKHWEKVATVAWPEVTQPVALSPCPDRFSSDVPTERQIVMPTRAAFDKAEAGRRLLRLEDEISATQRQLQERRSEYDGLGNVRDRLRTFVARYGDGKLAALERDLQAKHRHADALRTHVEQLKQQIDETESGRETARKSEVASIEELQDKIRPALGVIERFVAEIENRIEEIRNQETLAQDRLATIEIETKSLVSQREACRQALDAIQQQVFEARQRLQQLRHEANEIHHRDAAVDSELIAQPLETLRTGYQEQRRFYEGKQDVEAQVEIKAAEQVMGTMQRDFSNRLNDTSETEVDALAKPCDYAEARLAEMEASAVLKLDQAIRLSARREAESETARNESNERERKAPEGGKRRFPEGEVRPRTSTEASVLLDRGRSLSAQRQTQKQEVDEKVRLLGEQANEFEKQASEFEGQQNLLDKFQDQDGPLIELPENLPEIRAMVATIRDNEKAAAADEQRIRGERATKLGAARSVTVSPRFGGRVSLAKRFEAYTDENLLADLAQIRSDLDQRIASNRDRLAGLKQTREQLVHMMNGLADEILFLLRSIEKVSRLPEEGMGAWNGKSFIQISFHQPDEAERQVALRGLLEELIESRRDHARQAPDTDASGLMRLIVDRLVCDKRIHVQILKPTPVRTDVYENVEMLRHYSGGEGVTVAILMYLTIVQLRAQNVQSSRRLQDAGFLLLDNPFGKCNREDLVRMQVQLAEQLRVQLIVLTGLREPVIMMSYPRRVRLANDLVNRVTGAKHVRLDGDDGNISAVENLRRFSLQEP